MLIALVLFLFGIFIGLSYRPAAILIASLATTSTMLTLWGLRGELGFFSLFVLVGYLFALQGGYLLGSYLGLDDADALPEPDDAPRRDTQAEPPEHGDGAPNQNGTEGRATPE